MLQSMRSQTIGPTERLNNNTLTWPKVSPRTCVETKSTPPLGPPSHLCLEPVWKTAWGRNMGIFLGLEPGVSWAWQGGACGRIGEGCRPPCATHAPEQVGAGRGVGGWKVQQWEPEALGSLRETRSLPRLPVPFCVRPGLSRWMPGADLLP